MFPWKTSIEINSKVNHPTYLQICNQIINLISEGKLPPGTPLPGTRKMSELLSLNRKTVINAYDELIAQGWLTSLPSKGTFVNKNLPKQKLIPLANQDLNLKSTEHVIPPCFDYIPDFTTQPQIQVNDGSPDHRLAPTDWLYKECRAISKSNYGKPLLKYDDFRGDIKLRNELAKYLSETRGISCSKENILITRGSQMGIFLLSNLLISKGATVVVANFNYDASEWCITFNEGEIYHIPVQHDGICINSLEKACKIKNVQAVYITPHHNFPTTVTLSSVKRIALLQLSLKYNFTIIEDDYDYDFHYNSSPILPLASLPHQGRVAYIGSFSKIFAPSIRVGYVVADRAIIDQIGRLRRIIDRQGDAIMERAVAESITSGELNRHLKKVVREYKSRRNLFCSLLKEKLNHHILFEIPEGGMAVWVDFKNIDIHQLHDNCLKSGLYLNTNKSYHRKGNFLRLGFASLNEREIEYAINIIADESLKLLSS